jgi:hypothetical protein
MGAYAFVMTAIGGAEEHTDGEADHPVRETQRVDLRCSDDGADDESYREPVQERAKERRPLVGEFERKHRRCGERPVDEAGQQASERRT